MPLHHTWNSIALDRTGVAMLREAVQIAAKAAGTTREDERQHLASIVFSFYSLGLMDPRRLAEIAVLASSSRSSEASTMASPANRAQARGPGPLTWNSYPA